MNAFLIAKSINHKLAQGTPKKVLRHGSGRCHTTGACSTLGGDDATAHCAKIPVYCERRLPFGEGLAEERGVNQLGAAHCHLVSRRWACLCPGLFGCERHRRRF
jgi:hypothetical protein